MSLFRRIRDELCNSWQRHYVMQANGSAEPTLIKTKPRVDRNRVLVTGGAGFVGSHLCTYLVERGDHVSLHHMIFNSCFHPNRSQLGRCGHDLSFSPPCAALRHEGPSSWCTEFGACFSLWSNQCAFILHVCVIARLICRIGKWFLRTKCLAILALTVLLGFAQVICLDSFFTGSKDNVAHLLDKTNFELIRHDVVEPILLEVDQIYHLACPASPIHYK